MESRELGINATQQQQNDHQQKHLSFAPMVPLPADTPWNLDSMPWAVTTKNMENPDNVMQFCAQNTILKDADQRRAQLHQKRKSDILPPHPAKQFISEEKITAHFNGLHISSDYIQETNASPTWPHEQTTTFGKTFTNLTYRDYQVTAKELEEKLKRAQRITMCEEIKKLNEEQNKAAFLPQALLTRIEKPCTALVLWQRPPILELLQASENKKSTDRNVSDPFRESNDISDFFENNNSCSPDLNSGVDGMDTDL